MAIPSNCCRKKDVQKCFHYSHYLRGRKTARKTKPTKLITLKKKKSKHSIILISSSSSDYLGFKKEAARRAQFRSKSVGEYRTLDVIGQGSYGVVYRARDDTTEEIVAIKEELHGLSPSSLSEIDILESLNPHPSIIRFKDVVMDGWGGVYIVMEHVENDLKRYIANYMSFSIKEVRVLMKLLLEGVKFLHDNHVMHRDLKPSNVLINNEGELKICDFGLSCRFPSGSGEYSTRVGTQGYRAPELLLGDRFYSCAVDMWSVGCIMGELVSGEALFRGKSDVEQLDKILELVGSNGELVEERDNVIRDKLCFSTLNETGFDLLERLLTCDPLERITAEEALGHAWFKEC